MTDKPSADLGKIKQRCQLLIIGGGIYGAAHAWEAAHRGIDTLLAEKGDFANATSSNSLKVIHGGVRYLQQFNLPRSRRSALERRAFFRIAPHLVQALPCTLPTSRKLTSNRLAVGSGMALYNLLCTDRNKTVLASHKIPLAGMVQRADLNHALPPLAEPGVTGGALWHDGQAWHTERLVLAFLRSAANQGATVQNYMEARDVTVPDGQIGAVKLVDQHSGESFQVDAEVVLDCSSGGQFLSSIFPEKVPAISYVRGINLLFDRSSLTHAIGVRAQSSASENRMLFMTPWRDLTLIGTWYLPGDKGEVSVSNDEIDSCIDELNSAFQQALVSRDDLVDCHVGLLPLAGQIHNGEIDGQLMKRNQRVDLGPRGVAGAYIVRGTKYTMARATAEATVTWLARKHQWSARPSQSDSLALDGGNINSLEDEIQGLLLATAGKLESGSAQQLVYHFGSNAGAVLALTPRVNDSYELIPGTDMPAGAIDFVVANEWASSLSDLLLRRLELRSTGRIQAETLQYCISRLALLKNWNTSTAARQQSTYEQEQRPISR